MAGHRPHPTEGTIWRACPKEVVPLRPGVLPVLGQEQQTSVVPTEPELIAQRMVHSLAFERAALTGAYQQFRFAFPNRVSSLLESAGEHEFRLLTRALSGVPAYEVRHPYPVPLSELLNAAAPFPNTLRSDS